MEDFTHSGKIVEFREITGEIIDNNKYSETYISSSGGGGYVGQHGGYVNAPAIHSSTILNHEFWIKTKDGLEKSIKLQNIDIPLRVGQKITLITAGIKGKDSKWYFVLVNHNSGQHWFINDAKNLLQKLKLESITIKTLFSLLTSLLIASLIFLGIVYLTAPNGRSETAWLNEVSWGWASGLGLAFLYYRYTRRFNRIAAVTKKLGEHLENLAQITYKNH